MQDWMQNGRKIIKENKRGFIQGGKEINRNFSYKKITKSN